MLRKSRWIDRRIVVLRFQHREQIARSVRKQSRANGLRCGFPIGRCAKAPSCAFGNEAILNFRHSCIEPSRIAFRSQCSVVEKMLVNSIR